MSNSVWHLFESLPVHLWMAAHLWILLHF